MSECTSPGPPGRATLRPPPSPGLAWDWSAASLGVLYALPAAVAAVSDRSRGLALAVGVLPAAIIALPPNRRARISLVVLGVCAGLPMFLGGVLADVPVLAVVAVGAFGVGSAALAARSRFGVIAMTLSLPMIGVGLSYPGSGSSTIWAAWSASDARP